MAQLIAVPDGRAAPAPQFSADGRFLLVSTARAVKVYSAITGEFVLSLTGHDLEVTCVALNIHVPTQVFSTSRDGTLRLWDFADGKLLRTFSFGESITSLVSVVVTSPTSIFLSAAWREGQAGRVLRFDLGTERLSEQRSKLSQPLALVASTSGAHVATVDRHTLLVWQTANFNSKPLAIHHTKRLTCAALGPGDAHVAAGDVSGRIMVWYDFARAMPQSGREAAPVDAGSLACTTVHWHAHAVGCLTYSLDGKFLVSGGLEAVLVMWEVETGRRTYLPRLGAALCGVVASPADLAKYAVRQEDNTLRVVNMASMRVECSVHGVRPAPQSPSAAPTLQPGTGHLVLAGAHSMLQFYDAARDAHVNKLAVAPQNIVSLVEHDRSEQPGSSGRTQEARVVGVAFSADGSSLATLDVGADNTASGSCAALRFWDRTDGAAGIQYGSPYVLNTAVREPHASGPSDEGLCVSYHPHRHMVATTSEVGELKLWVRGQGPRDSALQRSKHTAWRCHSVGHHRGLPMHCSVFSEDGSVLAVSTGTSVLLWHVEQNTLLGVLSGPPACTGHVAELQFVSGSQYLVGVMHGVASSVVVWNILTCTVERCRTFDVQALATDPAGPTFAIGVTLNEPSQDGKTRGPGSLVLQFRADDPTPRLAWKVAPSSVTGAKYVADQPSPATAQHGVKGQTPLLLLLDSREFTFARTEREVPRMDPHPRLTPSHQDVLSHVVDVLGPSAHSAGAQVPAPSNATAARPRWEALFDTPSHVLPPLSTLGPAFLALMAKDSV